MGVITHTQTHAHTHTLSHTHTHKHTHSHTHTYSKYISCTSLFPMCVGALLVARWIMTLNSLLSFGVSCSPSHSLSTSLSCCAIIYGMRRNGFYCKNHVQVLWHQLWVGNIHFIYMHFALVPHCGSLFLRIASQIFTFQFQPYIPYIIYHIIFNNMAND